MFGKTQEQVSGTGFKSDLGHGCPHLQQDCILMEFSVPGNETGRISYIRIPVEMV